MNPNTPSDPNAMSLPQPQYAAPTPPPMNPGQPVGQPLPMSNASNGPALNPVAAPVAPMVALQTTAAVDAASPMTDELWAQKAKEVLTRLQNDPFALTEELYALRTQYMLQVHSRELKPKEEK